jgi:hypothetical protein
MDDSIDGDENDDGNDDDDWNGGNGAWWQQPWNLLLLLVIVEGVCNMMRLIVVRTRTARLAALMMQSDDAEWWKEGSAGDSIGADTTNVHPISYRIVLYYKKKHQAERGILPPAAEAEAAVRWWLDILLSLSWVRARGAWPITSKLGRWRMTIPVPGS